MEILSVYPLAKGVRTKQLTYFAPSPLPVGSLVSVPFGNRSVRAVVAESTAAKNHKSAIRSASYELKPIKHAGNQIFFAQFVTATENFARQSAVTTGEVLRALTPQPVIENNQSVPEINYDFFQPDVKAPSTSIIQTYRRQQYQYINSLIQTHVANTESVFVCNPTIKSCRQFADNIQTQAPVILLHSGITKNQQLDRWKRAITESGPVVIVSTATFLSIPRQDLGRIIVTNESSSAYKMQSRPFLSKQSFANCLAKTLKRHCTLVDSVLSTETQWEFREGAFVSEFKPDFQYSRNLKTKLVDMNDLPDQDASGVQVFSPWVVKKLRQTAQKSGRMLLFVARQGRRPLTACDDCGTVVDCKQCGLPLVLIENDNQQRSFVCRTCGNKESSARRCANCSSWRLTALGIGIDFVVEILKKHLPDVSVFQASGDTHSSPDSIESTMEDFQNSDASVLVTTKQGINYLDSSVDHSAVVTADSLLAIPDLSVSHELFSLLITMRAYTDNSFCIQTRSQETSIFTQALQGDVARFYHNQISQREKFNYPPFSCLIKLSVTGSKQAVQKHTQTIRDKLNSYNPQIYPTRDNRPGAHALIRLPRSEWVDEDLLEILRSLPLTISINAHPRSLL